MNKKIKRFIEDRRTPYSEIQQVEVDNNFVTYTEKYDLSHPLCPIVRIQIQDDKLISFSEVKKTSKFSFELLYGSIPEE
jgi:hypothetical protein